MVYEVGPRLALSLRTDAHRRWAAALSQTVAEHGERWQLLLGEQLRPGGYRSLVVACQDADGRECVLKIGLPEDVPREARALAAYSGRGTTQLLAASEQALLLERAQPGTSLAQLPDDAQQTLAVALCAQLWRPAAELAESFDHLGEMVGEWTAWLEQQAQGSLELSGWAPTAVAMISELADLGDCFLHGDLHEENVLCAQRGPLAVDPRSVRGDRAYDVEPLLRRYVDRGDLSAAEGMLAQLDDLGAHRERVLSWGLVRSVHYGLLSEQQGDHQRARRWLARIGVYADAIA